MSGKGSGWIIDSVIEHNINISKYYTLAGSSYIKITKKAKPSKKRLIIIQNIEDKDLTKRVDFRDFVTL